MCGVRATKQFTPPMQQQHHRQSRLGANYHYHYYYKSISLFISFKRVKVCRRRLLLFPRVIKRVCWIRTEFRLRVTNSRLFPPSNCTGPCLVHLRLSNRIAASFANKQNVIVYLYDPHISLVVRLSTIADAGDQAGGARNNPLIGHKCTMMT